MNAPKKSYLCQSQTLEAELLLLLLFNPSGKTAGETSAGVREMKNEDICNGAKWVLILLRYILSHDNASNSP